MTQAALSVRVLTIRSLNGPDHDRLGGARFQVIVGLFWSVFVAMIALGLNAIFGLLDALNLAHASIYAWGAMLV